MKLPVFRTYFFVLLERGLLGRREVKKNAENIIEDRGKLKTEDEELKRRRKIQLPKIEEHRTVKELKNTDNSRNR